MDPAIWTLLVEFSNRPLADLVRSHLEARDINVALFQDRVTTYGVGRIQLYVAPGSLDEAREVISAYLGAGELSQPK
jgi:hypothetical protein